jgi:WD40 repeat protein
VSGGSDHTVRIWDALTGQLLRRISDLFTTRDLDLGVFTVAIHKTNTDSIIGVGSVIEGYQLYSLTTGELLMDLDEPLTSRQHNEFEDEVYQQYAAKIEITETVVVTNAKVRGMLCVWCRWTGELLYRIRVCPSPISPFSCSPPSSTPPFDQGEGERQRQRQELSKRSRKMTRMVSHGLSESSRMSWRPRRLQEEENSNEVEEDEETVHTFKVSRSGSMLMCTLCDGRVALFEFGSRRSQVSTTKEEKVQEENEVMVVLGDSCDSRFGLRVSGAVLEVGGDRQQQQQQQAEQNQAQVEVGGHQPISSEIASVAGGNEGEDEEGHIACNRSALAWIWSRDRRLGVSHQHQQRVILV